MDEANDDATSGRAPGLGDVVLGDDALDELLQTMVVLAHRTIPGADSVSVTVPNDGGYRTSNFTDEGALALDEAQYDGHGGPCLEALRTARQVRVALGVDTTGWTRFEEQAREEGVTAVLSTPLLRAPGEAIGALNIYGRSGSGFAAVESRSAELIGQHATTLVGNAVAMISATRLNEQLRHAVASREIIGEAKGIVMEREGCTRDEALDVLRRASQRENRKLRDVATELVLRVEARKRDGLTRP